MSWQSWLGNARRYPCDARYRGRATCAAVVAAMWLVALSPQFVFGALSFSGDVSLNTGQPQNPVMIGRTSVGSLRLDNGTVFNSGALSMGSTPTGIGSALVTGAGTTWTMSQADIGLSGIGRLNIEAGGIADVMGLLAIGRNTGSIGTVVVDGAGSTLQVRGPMNVGGSGSGNGLLEISNGAIVNATQSAPIVGQMGRIKLDGGLLRLTSLNNSGLISGSGELSIMQNFSNALSGRLAAGTEEHLRISGASFAPFENVGLIDVDGGEIEILRSINNFGGSGRSSGEITLRNGTLRISPAGTSDFQITNTGLLAAIGGENHVHGTIRNMGTSPTSSGEIAITNQSVMIFHDNVNIQGGMMTVFPGSKATLLEDLSLTSGAMLLADIAGSDIDTDYGEIEVVGNVALGGQLQVTLSNGFAPAAGDTFEILSSVGGIEGSLSLESMPALPGRLVWDLDVTPNQVLLNVVPAPTGDFNLDGVVDTADYVVWRRGSGQADGNNDGLVDDADYALWRGNYGATAGSGAGSSAVAAAVPEPGTWSLLLFCLAATARGFSRRSLRPRA